MSLQVAHGSVEWLTSTAATGTYTQGDVGFTIKALIFWWTGIASGGADAATQAVDMRRGIGFATGTGARRCVASYDDDAALTSDSSTAVYDDCIAATHSNAAARDGALDITAMGTGFTLTVDDQLPTGNITLHWLALGGDDITVAVVGDFAEPASATTVDVTATGLTSDGADQVIFFAGAQSSSAINAVLAENGGISFGAATGLNAADQWCIAGSTDHASGTTDTDGIGGTGKVVAQAPLASGTAFVTAALTAWGTDQFTVTYAGTVVSARKNAFLAIKGGSWKVGSYTIAGNSGSATATVSDLPTTPKGIVIAGRMVAAQNAATGSANDRLGIGWGTSTSSRRTQGVLNENATASSAVEVNQVAEFDAVLAFPSTGGALQAAYDINAMGDGSFQIIVDTAGGVASEWQGYVAFGDTPVTGTGALEPTAATVDGTGGIAPKIVISWAQAEVPALSGYTGSGSLEAQAATVDGAGVSLSTGSGDLEPTAATIDGTGASSSTGTGALEPDASVLDGAGVVAWNATGALVAQAAEVDGSGDVVWMPITGSGSLEPDAADLTGAGVSASTGAGVLAQGSAVLDGAGTSLSTGTGTLEPDAATVDGIGIAGTGGVGALEAQAASIDGAGVSASTGSGALVAGASDVSGSGVGLSTGSGALQPTQAAVDGSGTSGSTGTGVLVAQAAMLDGTNIVAPITGSGNLAANAATIDGSGEVTGEVLEPASGTVLAPRPRRLKLVPDVSGIGELNARPARVEGFGVVYDNRELAQRNAEALLLMAA